MFTKIHRNKKTKKQECMKSKEQESTRQTSNKRANNIF